MRDGFIVHEKTMRMSRRLDPEDAGYLFWCLANYYEDGEIDLEEVSNTSLAVAIILEDALERMDADAEAYDKSVKQKQVAAQARWEKEKAMRADADAMRDDADACGRNAAECGDDAGNAVSVSVSVSESVLKEKGSPKGEQKKKVFRAPTAEEVGVYCTERGNNVDPQQFVDFYASKGWKVGNSPMKDWKAAVRTWEKRREAPPGKIRPINKGYEERTYDYDKIESDLFAKMLAEG